MRIAMYTDSTAHGGGGRVCALLTQIWTRLGHEVILFAESEPSAEEYHFDCIARETVHQAELTSEQINRLTLKYGYTTAMIVGRVGGRGFELMTEELHKLGVKVVAMLHHSFSTWFYFLCMEDEYRFKANLSMIDCLVCVDPLQTIWWHEMGANAHYIPNPVAFKQVGGGNRNKEIGIRNQELVNRGAGGEKVLVWAGRASDPGKRLDLMLSMFAEIERQMPSVRLQVLGDVDEKTIRSYRRQYGAELLRHVDFCGFVSDVESFYRKADLNVFTSLLEVTTPQVVLEAQACGLPTVTFNLPMLCDVDKDSGVVKCDTSEGFVQNVVELLADDSKLIQLRQASLEGAADRRESTAVEAYWRGLLNAFDSSDALKSYLSASYRKIDTPAYHSALLHEIQRACAYFCEHHFSKIKKPTTMRVRLARTLRNRLSRCYPFSALYAWRDRRRK